MRYQTIGNGDHARSVSVLSLGAMRFGTTTDEDTSYAILDRFVEAGGTFIDTSNNYAFWENGTRGGESETLLGKWRQSRGVGDEIVIATKVGGRPLQPSRTFSKGIEGLAPEVIRQSAEESRDRLGVERLDLYYAHVEDLGVPLAEQVDAFGALVEDGTVGLLGASNFWIWRLERARRLAGDAGVAGFEVLQYHHTYARARTDQPGLRSADGSIGVADGGVLSYVRENPDVSMVAYTPLIGGGYTRADKPIGDPWAHPGTTARLAALAEVATETGATPNQVVLAWLISGEVPVIPLVGASSVEQLDESLAAVDLELTPEQRARLDAAY